ncbi:ABC transporter permease [Rhodopseudomonas sp. B29]|uniref:ABC transporter permease n=1 Tax=Rhodopseudomonas sp. B29 TaxID=95607 RepID=UPI000346CA5C|nr:ABC transporter permease [Rhodopseudomonas sp. B29]
MTTVAEPRAASPIAATWRWLVGLPPAYPLLAILLGIAYFTHPHLLAPLFLMLMLRQAAPLGLATIGQSLVIRCRSIDLSSAGIMAVTSYILTSGTVPVPPLAAIALCILVGLFIGFVNGVIITVRKASAVIVTLAMSIILTGVVIAFSQFRAPGDVPQILKDVVTSRIGGIPVAPMLWILVLFPLYYVDRFTVFGRYVRAVGSNPLAAEMSGVPHARIVLVAHTVSGLFSVLSCFFLLGFVGVGTVNIGQDLALNSLSASILGGVNFGAGKGGMWGPAAAAFMLTFLFNFLTSFGLGEPGKLMLQGLIVIVAAIAYSKRQT